MDSPKYEIWKPDLYYLQLEAPTPKPVHSKVRTKPRLNAAHIFDREYWGSINHHEANRILSKKDDGSYLIRLSEIADGSFYTLSLRFNGSVHHFKLFVDDFGQLYVRRKRYKTAEQLVGDGLITMYVKQHASLALKTICHVCYYESPYMTLNRLKLNLLNLKNCKNNGNSENCSAIDIAKENVSSRIKKSLSELEISSPIISQSILVSRNERDVDGSKYVSANSSSKTRHEKYERSHNFKTNNFKGLNWCELCGNFLWGFAAQGVKCEDCGFIAHTKCSEHVPNDCKPELKNVRGVFGIDLTTLEFTMPNTFDAETGVPFVVFKCANEIEVRGLLSEGIYRLSAYQEEVEALKLAFDQNGDQTNLSENSNINVVASTLKLYFRLLPVPLITLAVYELLFEASKLENLNEKLEAFRSAIEQLPKAHYRTLTFLLKHLNRISLHQAINKMSSHNLATVFAPTLIRSQRNSSVLIHLTTEITNDITLLETLISSVETVTFGSLQYRAQSQPD